MQNKSETVNIRLRRDERRYEDFTIPFEAGMNVLSALQYIYENLDRTVAYPLCLCRMGKCGACTARVNGKVRLGCAVRLTPGETVVLEPIAGKEAVRDLIFK